MSILDKIKDIIDDLPDLDEFFEWDADKESVELTYGDVICIGRGLYDHYGVYANPQSVIHFSSESSDLSADNEIIETDLATFKRDDRGLKKLIFPKRHKRPEIRPVPNSVRAPDFPYNFPFPFSSLFETYKLYSPEETVQRARSQLGKRNYNILLNNCEHFAIWCKTGIHESHQINDLLKVIMPGPIYTR